MEKGGYGYRYRAVKNTFADQSENWTIEFKKEGLGVLDGITPWLTYRPCFLDGSMSAWRGPSLAAATAKIDECLRYDASKRRIGRKIENI